MEPSACLQKLPCCAKWHTYQCAAILRLGVKFLVRALCLAMLHWLIPVDKIAAQFHDFCVGNRLLTSFQYFFGIPFSMVYMVSAYRRHSVGLFFRNSFVSSGYNSTTFLCSRSCICSCSSFFVSFRSFPLSFIFLK